MNIEFTDRAGSCIRCDLRVNNGEGVLVNGNLAHRSHYNTQDGEHPGCNYLAWKASRVDEGLPSFLLCEKCGFISDK